MSEGLRQIKPIKMVRYDYWNLRDVTIKQLVNNQIIERNNYESISSRKPDGLIIEGKKVLVVVEYKDTDEFDSEAKKISAVNQAIEVAEKLKAKIAIATDGERTIWYNVLTKNSILDLNGNELSVTFDCINISGDYELEILIDNINSSITFENNKILPPKTLDPFKLATKIWQKIWINTGKEPEKCLYNVVELFIFKFLSDLNVLDADIIGFKSVYKLSQVSSDNALEFYANISRKKIKELFPKGEDGTTIINGTIFVNEKGDANIQQAALFSEVLKDFIDYEREYGSFKNIDKSFKIKLYEAFLKNSAGVRTLGQYFTPRKVVQAIVNMVDDNYFLPGKTICDPFCGVGGFVLETILSKQYLVDQYIPKEGKIIPKTLFYGFDKGDDEKDNERTIILAKANMLIHLSDLIEKYHKEEEIKLFSKLFNNTFHLIRDNLGTFSNKINSETNIGNYDLILSNPPYVSKGVSSIKNQILARGLKGNYVFNGAGTEGLALEWIIKHLNPGGQAIIVIPDGILSRTDNRELRHNILKNCILNAIVSLPTRTFFATSKKTYIISLTKKLDVNIQQTTPVFTYLIKNIGETRDANRIDIPENDFEIMTDKYNTFKGNPKKFVSENNFCKILEIAEFTDYNSNWIIDKYWSKEEKQVLGIIDESTEMTEEEFYSLLNDMKNDILEFVGDKK